MNVLVISPHPDDEALGCGGAILKHVAAGDTVWTVFCTSGDKGIPELDEKAACEIRDNEAAVASQILGQKRLLYWDEPDGGYVDTPVTREKYNIVGREFSPDLVYCPPLNDSHSDHRTAAAIVKHQTPAGVEIRTFEVWTPIDDPKVVLDISDVVRLKRAAIRCHRSQIVRQGFDEAILAINRYRGELHGTNALYAEVFGSLR